MNSTEIRQELLQSLRLDLVGPAQPEEILTDRPTVHYLTGILYPSNINVEAEEDERLFVESSDENEIPDDTDETNYIAVSDTMNPTAIGLTFAVDDEVTEIKVVVRFGTYSEIEGEWFRTPCEYFTTIDLTQTNGKISLNDLASLEWIIRPVSPRNISIFLVNRASINNNIFPKDEYCIFQPYIEIYNEELFPFIHRSPYTALPLDSDVESANLLYRDALDFAIGHGCSADWKADHISNNRLARLHTSIIPSYELPLIAPTFSEKLKPGLNMKSLADVDNADMLFQMLNPIIEDYDEWINTQARLTQNLTNNYKQVALEHIRLCREARDRIKEGLELLAESKAFSAFKFANQAMFLQRTYGAWAKNYRSQGERQGNRPNISSSSGKHFWRPFQIAFILLNLKSIIDETSDDRGIVDLLWFPTGGGKTEAYLGLAAIVMGYRRLRGERDGFESDGGVTIIMRYTLRLLTTQQFQRAATLICACEYLRRQKPATWGYTPFQIGLWVGSGATPNSIKGEYGAEEAINKLRRGVLVNEGNPMQLPSCPWCGEELTAWNYHIDNISDRLVVACRRIGCDFHGERNSLRDALPVVLVDDNIYQQLPTLILATVDKFARLPWKPQTMALFGRVSRYCPRHGYLIESESHAQNHRQKGNVASVSVQNCNPFFPPELIIQDELHLISGPLGTLAGLYEGIIDQLCSYSSKDQIIRPKIIASTATIRRAREQINSLFARGSRLFPPSGLKAGDSYFAQVQSTDEQPGRQYVGIFAPGRSTKTTVVRTYANLLHHAQQNFVSEGDSADPYMTLVGYFNSLRELGGTLRLIEDDIVQRLELLSTRSGTPSRHINNENRELTSRIPSYKIPEILGLLEVDATNEEFLDVLLATNMISVGVDVDRLGLMVVNGQPKMSSEYIQATSRVGRQPDKPGLVITLYNWTRPRDISHYERFRPYHESLYRHVEATSVTPFAPRARDKALHAVVIALARLTEDRWSQDNSAHLFDAKHPVIDNIIEQLGQRVDHVDGTLVSDVERQLERIIDWWEQQVTEYQTRLRYNGNVMFPDDSVPVLMHPAEKTKKGGSRPTLNSLREVEPESTLYMEWDD